MPHFMQKKILIPVVFLLIVLTVASCDYRNKPKLNPHPKYFVTISGNIEPHMPYPMTVMYKATYAAYNPKCDKSIDFFEGVTGMAGHTDYYPAIVDAKGGYKVRIPIDKYKPGRCNWKTAWVMFSFMPKFPSHDKYKDILGWGDVIRFGKNGQPQELPEYPIANKGTLYCSAGGIDKCIGSGIQGAYVNYVPRNKSYDFVQNVKSKRGKL